MPAFTSGDQVSASMPDLHYPSNHSTAIIAPNQLKTWGMKMKRYPRDPFWMTAKFGSECSRCKKTIRKGEQIFYYPNTHSALCNSDDCGKQGQRDLDSAKFDEANCVW